MIPITLLATKSQQDLGKVVQNADAYGARRAPMTLATESSQRLLILYGMDQLTLRTRWSLSGATHLCHMETLYLEVGAELESLPKLDAAFSWRNDL